MDNDELGALGEAELGKLAVQGSLVLNPAKRDRTGFDGLLELRTFPAAAAPDLVRAAFRAFVQVKTTRGPERTVGIKLSNWQRMVSDPSPWFVFVVRVGDDDEISDGYLVHVDEELSERALRALRETDGPLHKAKLSITFEDRHRITPLHGLELRRRLLEAIGADAFEYQQRKHSHYKTCGYGPDSWRATFEFDGASGEELIRLWEEIALGHRQSLEFKNVTIEDVRFGRAVVRSDVSSGAGKVTFSKSPHRGTLHVESMDRFHWVSLPAELYSTLDTPMVPAERAKARIKAGPLNFILPMNVDWDDDDEAAVPAEFGFDEATPCLVSSLASAARTLRMMTTKGATVSISFASEPGQRFKLLHANATSPGLERLAELEEWIAAGEVAARYGLDDLVVDPLEVLARAPGLTFLQAILGNTLRDLEFSVDVDSSEVTGERAVIMCPAALIGDRVLVACIAMFGVPEVADGRLVFKPERVHIEDVAVLPLVDLPTFPLGKTVARLGGAIVSQIGPERVIHPRHSNGLMFLGREPDDGSDEASNGAAKSAVRDKAGPS